MQWGGNIKWGALLGLRGRFEQNKVTRLIGWTLEKWIIIHNDRKKNQPLSRAEELIRKPTAVQVKCITRWTLVILASSCATLYMLQMDISQKGSPLMGSVIPWNTIWIFRTTHTQRELILNNARIGDMSQHRNYRNSGLEWDMTLTELEIKHDFCNSGKWIDFTWDGVLSLNIRVFNKMQLRNLWFSICSN